MNIPNKKQSSNMFWFQYKRCAIFSLLVAIQLCCLLPTAGGDQSKTGSEEPKKVHLGVFFESRCPDSRQFVVEQLEPLVKNSEFASILELTLVPFGKARIIGQDNMICQHGPRECEGNRLMACVDKYGQNPVEVVSTIACIFNFGDPEECVSNSLKNVTFATIDQCKVAKESFDLMVKFEQMTGKLSYVPHVTVNGQWSEEIQSECEQNLKSCVCKHYKGTKPSKCDQ